MKKLIQNLRNSIGEKFCATVLLRLATTTLHAQHYDYDYTNYIIPSVPGHETIADGISGNDIVGVYFSESIGPQGFLYDGTNYTTLSVPGAVETLALAICGNEVGGQCVIGYGATACVYDISNQTYTTLSFPGGPSATAAVTGISGNDFVGFYWAGNGTGNQGFLYHGSNYITLSIPGESETWAVGISGDNVLVDTDFYGGQTYLYNIKSRTYTALPFLADAISGNNILVGNEVYNIKKQTYTATLSVPGALQTDAYLISTNEIVGYYIDTNGLEQGFLATPVHARNK
jgi:hypothetical protein